MLGGIIATLLAAYKGHTLFAVVSGLLSTYVVFEKIEKGNGVWVFGWILLGISLCMRKKEPKQVSVVINEVAQREHEIRISDSTAVITNNLPVETENTGTQRKSLDEHIKCNDLFTQAVSIAVCSQEVNSDKLHDPLNIDFTTCEMLLDEMERLGIVEKYNGRSRKVNYTVEQWDSICNAVRKEKLQRVPDVHRESEMLCVSNFCRYCGQPVIRGDKFCVNCGTEIM